MTKAIVRSLLLGAWLASSSVIVQAGQASGPTTSPAHAEAFTAAQNALAAKRYAEVNAKANEVLASARKSADDVYAANYFLLEAARAQNDMPGVVTALEGLLGSGFAIEAPLRNQFRKALISAHYQQKNYAQVIRHGTEMIRSGDADDEVRTVVGQSHYLTQNYDEAARIFAGLVGESEQAGRRPEHKQLALLQDAYTKAGNATAANAALEKLVRYHPTPETWAVLLHELRRERLDPRQKLYLYRLMDSTGNLKSGQDFMGYAEAATSFGLVYESVAVLEAGLKAQAWAEGADRDRAQRYLGSAREKLEEVRSELSSLEAEARSAATGNEYVALGMTLHSSGDYPKAVQALQAGIAKGGLRNPADAEMALGIAQLKAGRKGEAAQVFRSIKTDDAVTQRLASLWALHAS